MYEFDGSLTIKPRFQVGAFFSLNILSAALTILWGFVAQSCTANGSSFHKVALAARRRVYIPLRGTIKIALSFRTVCGVMLVVLGAAPAIAESDEDWARLGQYAAENAALERTVSNGSRVVFLGDSITQGWSLAQYFPGKPFVNRGIGGQTAPQMLVRFRQDVVNLQPRVVVLLAGTNDLAKNQGEESLEEIEGYIASMCEIARANHIRVVLSSVLPVFDYPWRPGLQPAPKIAALNEWLRGYALQNKLIYVDYWSNMVDANKGMQQRLSPDGVHPNSDGYSIMAPLAEKAIEEALK